MELQTRRFVALFLMMAFASCATPQGTSNQMPAPAATPVARPARRTIQQKQQVATAALEELRIIDCATDQYAIEHNKPSGTVVTWKVIKSYLKPGTAIYNCDGLDPLGRPFNGTRIFKVDSIPKLNSATFIDLSEVAPVSFWSPYYP